MLETILKVHKKPKDIKSAPKTIKCTDERGQLQKQSTLYLLEFDKQLQGQLELNSEA